MMWEDDQWFSNTRVNGEWIRDDCNIALSLQNSREHMAGMIPQKILGAQETHCSLKRPLLNKFDGALSFGNVFCQFCGWHEAFHDEGGCPFFPFLLLDWKRSHFSSLLFLISSFLWFSCLFVILLFFSKTAFFPFCFCLPFSNFLASFSLWILSSDFVDFFCLVLVVSSAAQPPPAAGLIFSCDFVFD